MTPSTWHRLEIPYQMEQRISSFLRPSLQTELFVLALGREAAAATGLSPPRGCAFLGRCPAPRSSWNQSAHLLKKPLQQRSPAAASLPGLPGWGFIAFLKLQISVRAVPLKESPAPLPSTEISPRSGEGWRKPSQSPLSFRSQLSKRHFNCP